MPRSDWMGGAACVDSDPKLFFAAGGPVPAAVRKVCGDCVAHDDCLTYALEHNVDGIWAATTKQMRAELRKQRGITPEPLRIDIDDLTAVPDEPVETVELDEMAVA